MAWGVDYKGAPWKRTFKTAANLPQTTQSDLFTVSGGPILIVQLSGRVTTAIQNQLNNTKYVFDPTAGADVDLCAVASIANLAVGTMVGITGTLATALQTGLAIVGQSTPLVVGTGTIDLSCSASNTGQIEHELIWIPLDGRASVVAA